MNAFFAYGKTVAGIAAGNKAQNEKGQPLSIQRAERTFQDKCKYTLYNRLPLDERNAPK